MRNLIINKHIKYFFAIGFLFYNLFLASGFFSIFNGVYHQPPFILNAIIMVMFCSSTYLVAPQKIKILMPILSGTFFSVYFCIRTIIVFDFANQLQAVHIFYMLSPLIIGAIIGCICFILNKTKLKVHK